MNILLTALSVVALLGCFIAYTRCQQAADSAHQHVHNAERAAVSLRVERDRVTVLERELDALRRELRKLAGKFYAMRAELDDDVFNPLGDAETVEELALPGTCENYAIAQRDGPTSPAALCACQFCEAMRLNKQMARAAVVPKTVQGQAALAKVNAGKP